MAREWGAAQTDLNKRLDNLRTNLRDHGWDIDSDLDPGAVNMDLGFSGEQEQPLEDACEVELLVRVVIFRWRYPHQRRNMFLL
jgi:hypothetical protein